MPITATQINATPIGDGRQSVVFNYTFADGSVVPDGPRSYPAAADLNSLATTQNIMVEGIVKTNEAHDCIFRFAWDYVLKHTTTNELVAYVRSLYRESSKEELAKIAARVLEWIANGRFTDTQVRTAFGLTSIQWNNLKARMQTLADAQSVVDSATGE